MDDGRPREPILHADLDSFYASVEQRDDPALRGRPVLVGGGVVLAASYEAKAFGVRSAMNGREARDLCPDAVVVTPRFEAYSEASRAVFEVFHDVTPLVEGISIDEAFLDVGGLGRVSGSPVEIAVRLRARVRDEVGLPITVGIARTKFLAKVASGVAKPDGLRLVPCDGELRFLHPLGVQKLWGVGAKTAARLAERGITTVGEVAALDEHALVAMLGPASGRHLHALAHNRDPRPVVVGRRRRSIGAQRALGRRSMTVADIDATLITLVERTAGRLRRADRLARTVVLRLRFGDFTRVTRSHTLPRPTCDTDAFLDALRRLVVVAMPTIDREGLTLLGVTLANLEDVDTVQLELPFAGHEARVLDTAVDGIRDRFGKAAITRGVLVGHDTGAEVPLLPD
ncbi:DNA polymerase IV [uncultured Jatrophihabitans sp.]|uniref:DNA polymerase IV n=1 Tax=uncultured Jatrophihabitans sp. TaxID=1610747 RepID=UPI0035CB3219